jgi:hypothetical protein
MLSSDLSELEHPALETPAVYENDALSTMAASPCWTRPQEIRRQRIRPQNAGR